LREALRDAISPHAIAAVVSCLRGHRTDNRNVDSEIRRLAEALGRRLGGQEPYSRPAEEPGL
jgi:hypothetical protein